MIGGPQRSQRALVTDDQVVRRFFASLEGARRLPDSEVAALVRVAELDGEPATALRSGISEGRLFGAGLRGRAWGSPPTPTPTW